MLHYRGRPKACLQITVREGCRWKERKRREEVDHRRVGNVARGSCVRNTLYLSDTSLFDTRHRRILNTSWSVFHETEARVFAACPEKDTIILLLGRTARKTRSTYAE